MVSADPRTKARCQAEDQLAEYGQEDTFAAVGWYSFGMPARQLRRRSETVARARHKLQRRMRKYHAKLHDSSSNTIRRLHAVLAAVEAAGKQRQIASDRSRVIRELSSSREIIQQVKQVRLSLRLSSASWGDIDFGTHCQTVKV